jgi:polyhydroxybutyrate depolymerase
MLPYVHRPTRPGYELLAGTIAPANESPDIMKYVRILGPVAIIVAVAILDVGCVSFFGGKSAGNAVAHSSAGFPPKGSLSTAESRTLAFAGRKREYLIQPARGRGRHPVVIVLHGGDSDNKTVWTETSLPTLGAKFGFIVVAPNAARNRHWNDGRGTAGEGLPSTADDVGFLKALIAEVVTRDSGDANAVFMVGLSNGGIMTIHFACEAGHLLRAGSNVVSNIPTKQLALCRIGKRLPWLSINGDHDPRMPFNGYAAGTLILGHAQAGLESANRTFAFFADNAGCSAAVQTEALPDIDPSDGSTAEKRVREGCVGDTTSTQYVLRNAGHGWPGLAYDAQATRARGGINEDIDAGTVIWMHFQQTL